MLYVVVEIRNEDRVDFTLRRVTGTLHFGSYAWPESDRNLAQGQLIPAGSVKPLTLAVPLLPRPELGPEALNTLRQALQQGPLHPKKLGIRLKIDIFRDANHTYLTDEKGQLLALPVLPPRR